MYNTFIKASGRTLESYSTYYYPGSFKQTKAFRRLLVLDDTWRGNDNENVKGKEQCGQVLFYSNATMSNKL